MFGQDKNLKDSNKDFVKDTISMPAPYQAVGFGSGSYRKTNKLITALYMVTDIVDKEEPLRNKLRTLGTGIISDMYSTPLYACHKISEIMSFLDIASAINIISEMNTNILRKEFLELNQSIKDSTDKVETINRQINLSEFFNSPRGELNSKGHTRIGVQKGSTLMKALSDRIGSEVRSNMLGLASRAKDFGILKKQRRNDIIEIIRNGEGSATITDIKVKIKNNSIGSFTHCSEKTLQRELISMVKDGVLSKIGEKRWSRYFLKETH